MHVHLPQSTSVFHVRGRTQQELIDDAEHYGIGADAERECERCDDSECRVTREGTPTVAQISREVADEADA